MIPWHVELPSRFLTMKVGFCMARDIDWREDVCDCALSTCLPAGLRFLLCGEFVYCYVYMSQQVCLQKDAKFQPRQGQSNNPGIKCAKNLEGKI